MHHYRRNIKLSVLQVPSSANQLTAQDQLIEITKESAEYLVSHVSVVALLFCSIGGVRPIFRHTIAEACLKLAQCITPVE